LKVSDKKKQVINENNKIHQRNNYDNYEKLKTMSSADLDIDISGDPEELRNAGSPYGGRHGLHGRLDAGQQLS
jgi:hypothetical protein